MKEIHQFYVPNLPAASELPAEEAVHAVRVLRMKEGDSLLATDGRGTFYECRVTLATPKRCRFEVERTQTAMPLWQGGIHLAVAPTKNMERMEWLCEKATEIGWDSVAFLHCKNSERHIVKTERIEKIIVAATKQSRKAQMPGIVPMTDFGTFIARPFEGQKFIAHCHDDIDATGGDVAKAAPTDFLSDVLRADGQALVLIGPEGDFSADEVRRAVEAGFRPVSLGKSRLRTETAALVAVHLMNLCKRI